MDHPISRQKIRSLGAKLSLEQRQELLQWAECMVAIRESNAPAHLRARQAVRETWQRVSIHAVIRSLSRELKHHGWSERSWAARLGMGAAAGAAVTVGGKGAGIAAMGGAIGVPLWMVFGAGGALAGVVIEEVGRLVPAGTDRERPAFEKADLAAGIPEAEWVVLGDPSAQNPELSNPAAPVPPPVPEEPTS
jgi:hypothetical protein